MLLVIYKLTVLFAKIDLIFILKHKHLKKYWGNGKKYWKSQGILSVQKSGNRDKTEQLPSKTLVIYSEYTGCHDEFGYNWQLPLYKSP